MYYYYTKDKVIKEIAEHNKELQNEIYKLDNVIAGKSKPQTLKEVKKMSIWQFIKWRRNG